MIFMIIGLVLLAAAVAGLAWQNYRLRDRLAQSDARCRAMQRDRDIRRNLQHICNARAEEIRRLRESLEIRKADYAALEDELEELKVSLFNETGRRIVAEKEDGARNLKMDTMERELNAARQKLRERDVQARAEQEELRETIRVQARELERLQNLQNQGAQAQNAPLAPSASANSRRVRRAKAEVALDQVTLDDILNGSR